MRQRIGALAPLLFAASLAGCSSLPGLVRPDAPLADDAPTRFGGVQTERRVAIPPSATPSASYEFLIANELARKGQYEQALAAFTRVVSIDPDAPVWLHMADLAAKLNRPEEALEFAERAWEGGNRELSLRLFLGALYGERREVDAATEVLTDEDGAPMHPDAAVVLSSVYFSVSQLEAARDVAVWLEENEPEQVRGTLMLSAAVEGLGDPATAERILREGLARHPGNLRLYQALAESRRGRADRVGELGVYNEILALDPDDRATLIAKADAEIELGRTEAAMETLETIERVHPSDLRATLRLAFLDYEADDWEAAERRFSRAFEAFPAQSELGFFLGVVRREAGRPDEALAVLDDIEPDQDRYVDARIQIADIYEEQGDLARGLDSLDRALEVEPRRSVQLYRSTLQARSGDRAGAIAYLEALLEPEEPDPEVYYHLGLLHGEGGDRDEALRLMERVLETDANHAAALNYVGYALAEQGENLDEAEQLISRALEQRPDDGFITDSLGWVFFQRAQPLLARGHHGAARGWLLRAEAELLRAETLSGGDPVISEHLGDVYHALGRPSEALVRYEDAVRRGRRPGEQPDLETKLEALRQELAGP